MNLYGNNLFYAALFVSLFVLQLLWHFVAGKRSAGAENESTITRSEKIASLVFCICTGLAIASLFRLFPGNGRAPMEDSSAFLYIGERMQEGKQPYSDMFDHKGPLLYLIQYIGLGISPGNYSGVWMLEVLNMAATLLFAMMLARTETTHDDAGCLAVLAAFGVCGWKIWQGGNFTEEYALPWITLAACVLFRFFQTKAYRKKDIILLGFGFTVVLLLRANMVAVWAALIPAVLIQLLMEKRFREIGKCMFLFLTGVAILLVPVLIWAFRAGFLKDMWQDYILFNLQYTDHASSTLAVRLQMMLRFAEVIWPGTLAVAAGLILGFRQRIQWFNLLFYVVSLYTAAMSGRTYHHYAIVLLPSLVIPFSSLFNWTRKLLNRRQSRKLHPAIAIATSLVILLGAFAYRRITAHTVEDEPITVFLSERTEKDDDILVLGKSQGYYIQADRKTENRFFYQLPPLEISQILRDEFKQELKEHPSDYIILPGDEGNRNSIREKLGDVWPVLENEILTDYWQESFDSFEVYIRKQEH